MSNEDMKRDDAAQNERRAVIYMRLHETIPLGSDYEVLAVLGGWIYTTLDSGKPATSCFVPGSHR